MPKAKHSLSIFDQALDRASAAVYFLGAVIPLGALAWLVLQRMRPLGFDVRADWFIAALGLVGGLTLLSFLALRRMTRAAMRTIERENAIRARMLTVSRALAAATEADEVLRLALTAIEEIVGASRGVVFAKDAAGEMAPRERSSAAMKQNLHHAALHVVAAQAQESLALAVSPADRAFRPRVGNPSRLRRGR
jgi:hypothetical protein